MTQAETVEIVVEEGGDRLDRFLADRLDLTRSRIEQLIVDGDITVNNEVPKKRYKPSAGDRIRVRIPAPAPATAEAEAIPLQVVYQDRDLLVIDKQAGMVVHPAPGNRTGTLVNALLHHVDDLSGIGGVLRPGIVHRLDRDTSGLMIVAKNDDAHVRLSRALKKREIQRGYLTLAWGHLDEDRITVDAPIARHPRERKKMAVVEGGKRAVTHFTIRERWVAADLIEARLETGRTHQIRVHLAHVGHPVVGDAVYSGGGARGFSGKSRAWATGLESRTPRQFLHAASLAFRHPRSGREMEFSSDLPPDLQAVVDWAHSQRSG